MGPNALVQTAIALHELEGDSAAAVLAAAGETGVREMPADDVVDERRFTHLVGVLLGHLGEERTEAVLKRSGELAAENMLESRIPQPFQWMLRRMPADLGLRLLLGAVASNAWRFAGSGQFRYELKGSGVVEMRIEGCPACRGLVARRPVCGFYAATFEHLFRSLVDDRIRVREAECQACGSGGCGLVARPE